MNTPASMRPQWQNPPWILPAYFLFTVLATALGSSIFFAPELHRMMVPVVGWNGLGVYMFMWFFVITAMITPMGTDGIVRFHFLVAAFGVVDLCLHLPMTDDFDNPYLMYSPWRPWVTIVLPLFWAVVLGWLPSMVRWNNQQRALRVQMESAVN